MPQRYGVMAHRGPGSPLGAQSKPLQLGGKNQEFDTREEAEATAQDMNKMTFSPNVWYSVYPLNEVPDQSSR